jgi:hypothetical protein
MLNVCMLRWLLSDFAACHYAECRSAERRGAILMPLLFVACGDDIRSNTDERMKGFNVGQAAVA